MYTYIRRNSKESRAILASLTDAGTIKQVRQDTGDAVRYVPARVEGLLQQALWFYHTFGCMRLARDEAGDLWLVGDYGRFWLRA